jgi:hypothetical protein
MEERIGIQGTRKVRNYILDIIHDNKAELLQRQSITRGIYLIPLADEYKDIIGRDELYVVYNKERKKLITVLEYTKEQIEEFRRMRRQLTEAK